ncbi:hypothetical protein [Cysteiniphilum sp. 6C5]|uniref:hypothetical protein n=1 Tax=unclassified Cysteiniphilum TaxID=2610889 RepID=UPI003F848FD9
MLKHFIYNLSKNDPGAHVLSMVIKVGAIMLIYFLIAWRLGFVYEVIIWVFYFLAFAAIVCAVGDIYSRRKIFIWFLVGFALALTVSYWLHPYKLLSFTLLIICAYYAFWVRKYDPIFNQFPGYLVIVLAISSIQLPVLKQDLTQLYISLLCVGTAFFVLVLMLRPWDTPRQLLRTLQMHAILLQNETRYILHMVFDVHTDAFDIDKTNKEVSARLMTLHSKGASWIILPKRKIAWHKCYGHYHSLVQNTFRLLFFYYTLSKRKSDIAERVIKKTALKDIIYMSTKLAVWVFLINENEDFERQLNQFKAYSDHFKEEVLTASTLKGCQVLIFEILLLLESLHSTALSLREAADEIR